MSTITISLPGECDEALQIELSDADVRKMYLQKQEQLNKITELEKKIVELEKSKKWAEESRDSAQSELTQAHTLLTAMGVPDKTEHEDTWRQKDLQVTTRFALYLAMQK